MSTQKTANYQLHRWLPQDDFLLEEINANFGAIDGLLARMPESRKLRIATGTYIGNGNYQQTISLDLAPKAAIVACRDSGSYYHVSLVLPEADTMYASLSGSELTVNSYLNFRPGVSGSADSNCNPYRYIAFDWEE